MWRSSIAPEIKSKREAPFLLMPVRYISVGHFQPPVHPGNIESVEVGSNIYGEQIGLVCVQLADIRRYTLTVDIAVTGNNEFVGPDIVSPSKPGRVNVLPF